MDSFINKTDEEIKSWLVSLAEEHTGLKNIKSTGVLNGLLEVIKYITLDNNRLIADFIDQMSLDKATGIFLDLWGLLLNVPRKEAVKTTGLFTGVSYGNVRILKESWISVPGSDLRFKVLEDVNTSAPDFDIMVAAEFPGSQYNLSPETAVAISNVVTGLDEVIIENDWITITGIDQEKDDVYRARIKALWRSQGEGNPPSKYEFLATTIDGVSYAKVIRTPRGAGSMDLIVVAENGIPGQALIDEVRNKIKESRLVCSDMLIKPPVPIFLNISIRYKGAVTKEEMENAIRDYIAALPIGALLEVRNLYYEPFKDFNLAELEISDPIENKQAPDAGIFTINSLEITPV